ncbi:MAG: IS630 family transposase [Roseiflexus sp.]|nr:IS630 family transposase [Roseiflexus sp.]
MTSSTRRCTPSSERASRPNSKFRVRAIKKNPDALTAFRRDCGRRLAAAIPAGDPRPIRVFSQDERRFGLLTIRRRRLTARGVQPVGIIQHVFQSFYLYGAVAPTSGERFFLESPALNADQFQRFLDAFSQAFAASLNILVLDTSGAHTARRLTIPENVRLVFLPPYCPELNPIERVWRDLKDELAWREFADLAALQAAVTRLLDAYDDPTVQSLTGAAYLVDAVHALCS